LAGFMPSCSWNTAVPSIPSPPNLPKSTEELLGAVGHEDPS
jgi:hypothetical protein